MTTRLRFFTALLIVLGVSNSGIAFGQADHQFTPGDILGDRTKGYFRGDIPHPGKILQRFETAMTQLSTWSLPPATDTSAEAEVIRIAHDRAEHPGVYKELEDFYILTPRLGVRASTAPMAQSRHISETYRLAWEYIVLRPLGTLSDNLIYPLRAEQALSRIHNDDTISIYLNQFNHFIDYDAQFPESMVQQQTIIALLSKFPSERGIEALLYCCEISRLGQEKAGLASYYYWDPAKCAREDVSTDFPPGNALAWAQALDAFRRNPLKRDKQAAFSRLLGGPGANP
jgi:hypothetical protein